MTEIERLQLEVLLKKYQAKEHGGPAQELVDALVDYVRMQRKTQRGMR